MEFIESLTNVSFLGFDHWGYVFIFFTALLEAVPFLGLFAPGMVAVIAGGFLVKLGTLNIGNVILLGSMGAILGDMTGFMLGKKYGLQFLQKYGKYFFFKEKQYEKTQLLIRNHTGKAVILGRFNSLTRSFAPFVAGATKIPFGRFMVFNITGGVAWVITFVTVGYIFGESYAVAVRYIGGFVTIAIVVSIVFAYIYNFINKRKHIFTKYHLYTLIVNILSLYIFSKMVEDVLDGESVIRFDIWLNQIVTTWWSPYLNEVVIFITNIASPLYLTLLSLLLVFVFFTKRKWYYLVLLTTGMIGGLLFETIIKLLMHRERPLDALINETSYSFPSGHATMAIIFFVVVLFAFRNDIKNKILRIIFTIFCITSFLAVGFSRIYLNVHWFSDVMAGFALGLFWITLLVLISKFFIAVTSRTLSVLQNFFLHAVSRD